MELYAQLSIPDNEANGKRYCGATDICFLQRPAALSPRLRTNKFRTIASFRRGESLVRWLAGIEVNFMRRRWAERSPGEIVPFGEGEDPTASMWRLEELNAAEVRRLSPEDVEEPARRWAETQLHMTLAKNQKYMAAVRLRFFEKFDYSTIEDALGLSKNQAKVCVQRGLKVLKQMHEADVPEDPPRTQGQ